MACHADPAPFQGQSSHAGHCLDQNHTEASAQSRRPKLIDILRRFLGWFLKSKPSLSKEVFRAIHALRTCRTPARGGHVMACNSCRHSHIAWHSCNHKICPQCGGEVTAQWVQRELSKRVGAPYFMVTFTVPEEVRPLFFGKDRGDVFGVFFQAAWKALSDKLAAGKKRRKGKGPVQDQRPGVVQGSNPPSRSHQPSAKRERGPGFVISGALAALHTWNQKLQFHPHIHFIVPGAGIDENGKVITVKKPDFLVRVEPLAGAFREAFRKALQTQGIECDPAAWHKPWGVHIQACGDGSQALKYVGAYVGRGPMGNSRIVSADDQSVTFTYKDRAEGGIKKWLTLAGVEFVRRFLRHVLPAKFRSMRYYGYCHPAAKKNLERIRLRTGQPILIAAANGDSPNAEPVSDPRRCPKCQGPMECYQLNRELAFLLKMKWMLEQQVRGP